MKQIIREKNKFFFVKIKNTLSMNHTLVKEKKTKAKSLKFVLKKCSLFWYRIMDAYHLQY